MAPRTLVILILVMYKNANKNHVILLMLTCYHVVVLDIRGGEKYLRCEGPSWGVFMSFHTRTRLI
jgi:hypothetical protein